VAVADPFDPPLQLTLVVVALTDAADAGCVTTAVAVVVHALASVAVTVYVPAVSVLMDAVVAPVFQLYVAVPVPPVELAVADPLLPPKQLMLVTDVVATNAAGWVMATVAVAVHELASVAVTVYVPAVNPDAVAPVALLLQA